MNNRTEHTQMPPSTAHNETLRLALADATELRTESVDSYCAGCELSAQEAYS